MEKGKIRVQTENIFPIIKKFLYSDHEIFLRELVSNAVDACQKLQALASKGEVKGETGPMRIDIILDKKAGTITVSDSGIGMTREEVDKYLNQVAFSSAEEFLEKYKDASIIGHFGLGFYSAFMVADKVEVFSRSSYADAPGVFWSCEGNPEFELKEKDKESKGTDVVLHINDENREFLDESRLSSILDRFCSFLPVPIYFSVSGEKKEEEEKPVNNTHPLWIKKPTELKPEDYENFYRELYPFSETPLFWIHLNVDYPFTLNGVLYFPKIKQSYEIQKNKIRLYSNQVFVTDEVKEIVPEFLMLLHGVIDSPDIPLNVSRSYLQGDPNVRKINNHITKKVADKLNEIFTKDRSSYEQKWENLGLFVKYGMMTDEKFFDKATGFLIMEERMPAAEKEGQDEKPGKYVTIEEYKKETESVQKNKEGKFVVLYTTDPVQQDAYIRACHERGYRVVVMNSIIDAAFISQMELKWNDVHFVRVDADIIDNLIDKQETHESALSNQEEDKLKSLFGFKVPGMTLQVEVKGLSGDTAPVVATRSEQMRRMKEMSALGGEMAAFYSGMPDDVKLTVNGNHPVFIKILKERNHQQQEKQVRNLADLALLSQGLLKGSELTDFINRSVELMEGKKEKIIITPHDPS